LAQARLCLAAQKQSQQDSNASDPKVLLGAASIFMLWFAWFVASGDGYHGAGM
jgi:hypothetical protein